MSDNISSTLHLNDVFEAAYYDDDLLAIWTMVQFIATGEGADSFIIDVINLFELKREPNEWFKYTEKVCEYARKIMDRDMLAEEKITRLLSGYYILGMRGYKPLESQVDRILGTDKWPDLQTTVNEFRKVMTLKGKGTLNDDSENGRINAMKTSINECGSCNNCVRGCKTFDMDEMEYIGACNMKTSKFNGNCFNCGKQGHSNLYCQVRPWAICNICKNRHKTEFHDEALKIKRLSMAKRNKDNSYKTNNNKGEDEQDNSKNINKRVLPKAYTAHLNINDSEIEEEIDQWAIGEAMDQFERDNDLVEMDVLNCNTNVTINNQPYGLRQMMEAAGINDEELIHINDQTEFNSVNQYNNYKKRLNEPYVCNNILESVRNWGSSISNLLFGSCSKVEDTSDDDIEFEYYINKNKKLKKV